MVGMVLSFWLIVTVTLYIEVIYQEMSNIHRWQRLKCIDLLLSGSIIINSFGGHMGINSLAKSTLIRLKCKFAVIWLLHAFRIKHSLLPFPFGVGSLLSSYLWNTDELYCTAGSRSWCCGQIWTEVPQSSRTGVTHSLFRGFPPSLVLAACGRRFFPSFSTRPSRCSVGACFPSSRCRWPFHL